jgi:hypothetical protein
MHQEADNTMVMFFNRDTQAHDFAADSAYRSYLISRNQAPIVHHSGDMQWKRVCVALRRVRNDIKSALASIHMALVADKMRRARQELARVNLYHGAKPTPVNRGRTP